MSCRRLDGDEELKAQRVNGDDRLVALVSCSGAMVGVNRSSVVSDGSSPS